jgi:hypothetical protein
MFWSIRKNAYGSEISAGIANEVKWSGQKLGLHVLFFAALKRLLLDSKAQINNWGKHSRL